MSLNLIFQDAVGYQRYEETKQFLYARLNFLANLAITSLCTMHLP